MNSKRLWATTATVFALSAFSPRSPGVWAQSDPQAVCHAGWDWNVNSLGQDPCTVSSLLDGACRGLGTYTIPPLNGTQNYVPPRGDTPADLTCDCDSVMYSLYMACSTCQGGLIYSWTKWIAQCDRVLVTQYPHDIPQGTAVPQWAFYNYTGLPDQTYNDTVAMTIGRNPEATPKVISTSTLDRTSSTSRSSPTITDVPIHKSNTGAIVGGVVGTIVPLSIFGILVFLYLRRRKQRGENPPPPPPHALDASEYYKSQPTSPILRPISGNLSFNPYYNPNDPTTFPPPMGDGQSSTTYLTTVPPNEAQGRGPGRYSGIPEI